LEQLMAKAPQLLLVLPRRLQQHQMLTLQHLLRCWLYHRHC
jgi:hypothetical protein